MITIIPSRQHDSRSLRPFEDMSHDKDKEIHMNPLQSVPFSGDGTQEDDIEVAVDHDRVSMAPRDSFLNSDGEIIFPNNGHISFLEYLRLAELYERQIRRRCGKLANPEDNEDKEFLESTHLILYKWRDYFSFPNNLNSNFLYGRQKKLPNGEYDETDNNRFLIGFRDHHAFFVVLMAYIVLFAELAILIGIVYNLIGQGCDGHQSADVTSLAISMCTFYAASVASNSYFRFLPFELTGQTPAGYCVLTEAAILRGEASLPTYFSTLLIFKNEFESIAKANNADKETKELMIRFTTESALNELIIWVTTISLQLCNLLLLMTVAMVMATSPDLLSLIQNFVSVEIVVHIHEFIPRALRFEDLSPEKFNASYVDWYKELERTNLLRTNFPNTEARIRRTPDSQYRRIFIIFCIFTFLVYYVTSILCDVGVET